MDYINPGRSCIRAHGVQVRILRSLEQLTRALDGHRDAAHKGQRDPQCQACGELEAQCQAAEARGRA